MTAHSELLSDLASSLTYGKDILELPIAQANDWPLFFAVIDGAFFFPLKCKYPFSKNAKTKRLVAENVV